MYHLSQDTVKMTRARSSATRRAAPRAAREPAVRAERGKYFSKVVGKALDALDIIRDSTEPLSLNELTLRLGFAKSSLFRILHTLETASYLQRDPAWRYVIAPALRVTAPNGFHDALIAAALPRMHELRREFGETVSVAMRFENHIEVVATLESPQLIRMGNTVGRILPPHASSLGKAITAFQTEERREPLVRSYGLHPFTAHSIADEVELKRELEAIRSRGYSTDLEESVLEGCCFGAPIRDAAGQVTSAISLSMPKMRLTSDLRERIVTAVRNAAGRISETLQSSPARAERPPLAAGGLR